MQTAFTFLFLAIAAIYTLAAPSDRSLYHEPKYDEFIEGVSQEFKTRDGGLFYVNDATRASQIEEGLDLGLTLYQVLNRWHMGTPRYCREISTYTIPTTLEPSNEKKEKWIANNLRLLEEQLDKAQRWNGPQHPLQSISEVPAMKGALRWYLDMLRWRTDSELNSNLLRISKQAQKHIQNSHWTTIDSGLRDTGTSVKWIQRRIQHWLPQQDGWTWARDRVRTIMEEYYQKPLQYCNLLEYQDPDTGVTKFRTVLIVDDATFTGNQAAMFLRNVKKELNTQNVAMDRKVKVFMGYAFASYQAIKLIECTAAEDVRIELILEVGGLLQTVQDIIDEKGLTLEHDLTTYNTNVHALRCWLEMMHGPTQVRPDYNAYEHWSFPNALEMHTTILAHKVPDEVSLLYSRMVEQGLGGQFGRSDYGLVLLDSHARFYDY